MGMVRVGSYRHTPVAGRGSSSRCYNNTSSPGPCSRTHRFCTPDLGTAGTHPHLREGWSEAPPDPPPREMGGGQGWGGLDWERGGGVVKSEKRETEMEIETQR